MAKVSEHFLVEREHVDIIPPTPQTSRRLTTLGSASKTGKVSLLLDTGQKCEQISPLWARKLSEVLFFGLNFCRFLVLLQSSEQICGGIKVLVEIKLYIAAN